MFPQKPLKPFFDKRCCTKQIEIKVKSLAYIFDSQTIGIIIHAMHS